MEYLHPCWSAPPSVKALVSYRNDDGSLYGAFNLADHVGDDPLRVAANRRQLLQDCPGLQSIQWLEQVHGSAVVDADQGFETPVADACYSRRSGRGCAVMTADCLPVLFCDTDGRQVAAAHAGWRGLAAGVLEQTLATFSEPAENIMAWLGPAISQPFFEVGPEVREQFLQHVPARHRSNIADAFTASANQPKHYMADLYHLARVRLQMAGVERVSGGNRCTYAEEKKYYSYRRDGQTGRMASLIYLVD